MSSETAPETPLWVRVVSALGRMGILVTLVLTLASFWGRYSFWAEICTHFVNLYAVAGVLGAVLILPARQWRWMLLCGVVAILNAARMAPLYLPTANADGGGVRFTVVTANVLSSNDRYEAVIDYLRGTGADVLLIQEVTEVWQEKLQGGLPEYAHVVSVPRDDNFGIAVLSKLPLTDSQVVYFGGQNIPAIVGAVNINGGALRFVNLHTMPPGSPYGLDLRNRQMTEAAAELAKTGGAGLLIGDFNCSPWSPYFRDLLREYGLVDARLGSGVLATWPAATAPFMIPIDQCLTTRGVRVAGIERGPKFGSDHLPLQIELAIPSG